MKLTKGQKLKLLQWVAEGLQTDEINDRAAHFDPPFTVSRQQVDGYRKRKGVDMAEITHAGEHDALATGLAIRANRVAKLQALADLLEADLFGESLWVSDVKVVNGETVYITRPNQAWVSEYQKILSQIADEVGDKKPDQIIPSEITVRFVKPEGQP